MSDTTTLTRRPTPAQDASIDYESTATEARQAIYLATALKYERVPASAVKAEVNEIRTQRHVGKTPTKESAIAALAYNEWLGSEERQTQFRLERDARKEQEAYLAIDQAKAWYEKSRATLVADAQDENKRLRTVMEAAAQVRDAQIKMQLWEHVEFLIMEHAFTPLDALEKVREVTAKELTTTWTNRALSRSTSILANLDEDIEREAKAEWLDWGRYL